jgi:putative membrane protein
MKKILSGSDREQLNRLTAETEKCTDTQIVLAVIKRSDSYSELPWKAFSLGSSVCGLLLFILNLQLTIWPTYTMVLITLATMLIVGIIFTLLASFIPQFAKLFLSPHRAEEEVQQYAESLFLKRELFATSNRKGILLLVSLFERQIIILPDKGISNRLTPDTMQNIIKPMTLFLKRNEVSKALKEGLKQISLILETQANDVSVDRNKIELSNEIIEETGE